MGTRPASESTRVGPAPDPGAGLPSSTVLPVPDLAAAPTVVASGPAPSSPVDVVPPSPSSRSSLERPVTPRAVLRSPDAAAELETARRTILLGGVGLAAGSVGAVIAALAGLVRVVHGGDVTLTESVLLVLGGVFAAATPLAFYAMHVRRAILPHRARTLVHADDVRHLLLVALAAYGGLSLAARLGHVVVWREARGLDSGAWDLTLFVVSVALSLAFGRVLTLLRNLRRRRLSVD